jgi:hypothetical protein
MNRMTPKNQSRADKQAAKPYKRTEADLQMYDRVLSKWQAARKGRVRMEGNVLMFDHEDYDVGQAQLMESLNVHDQDFLHGILNQLANIAGSGAFETEKGMNFILSVVKNIEPQDHVEVMLAVQMAAVHMASMTFTRRLNYVANLPQQDSAEKALNKLMRTFTAQMEALRKYRTGGEQKVTVQHVHVNEGGQAVVGTVTHPGGGGEKSEEPPHAVGHAESTEMPGQVEAQQQKVSVTSRQG